MTSQLFERSVILCAALLAVLPARLAQGRFSIETKIAASDATGEDRFGNTVSISGDTALAGASKREFGGPSAWPSH